MTMDQFMTHIAVPVLCLFIGLLIGYIMGAGKK